MAPIRLLICSGVIVGRSTALVAGICVSSPGLSEMNFNLCANMQLSLHHDRFLANDDGSRYS